MITNLAKKVFGSRNDRLLKTYKGRVDSINKLEETFIQLSDDELRAKTDEFKSRLSAGEALDSLLPEAFATVREASKRVLNMRHFDVQLIGGMALHEGKIAEMRTGEGKTLVATLPLYLNALSGRGVHLVTVNDYLARRDAAWMSNIYGFLGLTTGVVVSDQKQSEKKTAYDSDITYGTNNEFGFDYLRNNMVFSEDERVMRDMYFAVIDEVDSVLIDESRTPLIISGSVESQSEIYVRINGLAPLLKKHEGELEKDEIPNGDFILDEKNRNIIITEQGHEAVERWLEKNNMIRPNTNLYDVSNISLMHHVNSAIKAHNLFEKNRDYIVENGEIVIIDEFTGRKLSGRRWSEGLHQAVEAKEGVHIKSESQTLASITFQNYFRLYDKLSGMTGTAETEAAELVQTYQLEVVIIPPNKTPVRLDHSDLIYLNLRGKFNAIIGDIKECLARQQPVLVGTASIEMSEQIAQLLTKEKIPHAVLNAKQHEKEALVIENAGRPGSVTIATNMAGRGTDIVLGGNLEAEIKALKKPDAKVEEKLRLDWEARNKAVLEAGGLHVIGSERHESRRIDNQLRGRSGRQGDPGSTRFYLSLEDDLMRIFASDRVKGMMQKLGMNDDEAIEHSWINKAIENAQKKIEGRNYDYRKQLLEYDDVANEQRKIIFRQRKDLMGDDTVEDVITDMRDHVVNELVDNHIPPSSLEEHWQIGELESLIYDELGYKLPIGRWLDDDDNLNEDGLRQKIIDVLETDYEEKTVLAGEENMRQFERVVLLRSIDFLWRDHLAAMDRLRQGIHLRGYAQKNPIQEYKKEAFELFEILMNEIKHETIRILSRVRIESQEKTEQQIDQLDQSKLDPLKKSQASHQSLGSFSQDNNTGAKIQQPAVETVRRTTEKVGRNAPCPCGSGKKYKQCHGRT